MIHRIVRGDLCDRRRFADARRTDQREHAAVLEQIVLANRDQLRQRSQRCVPEALDVLDRFESIDNDVGDIGGEADARQVAQHLGTYG